MAIARSNGDPSLKPLPISNRFLYFLTAVFLFFSPLIIYSIIIVLPLVL